MDLFNTLPPEVQTFLLNAGANTVGGAPKIFARLTGLMQEDKDAQVRDAAYSALMRLAAAPEEGQTNLT